MTPLRKAEKTMCNALTLCDLGSMLRAAVTAADEALELAAASGATDEEIDALAEACGEACEALSAHWAAKRAVNGARSAAAHKGWEKRREREEAVTVNIAADHNALWAKVGASIKGDNAHTRFERFEEYCESHPKEVIEALTEQADAATDAMIAEYESRFENA